VNPSTKISYLRSSSSHHLKRMVRARVSSPEAVDRRRRLTKRNPTRGREPGIKAPGRGFVGVGRIERSSTGGLRKENGGGKRIMGEGTKARAEPLLPKGHSRKVHPSDAASTMNMRGQL
jgi:hypothetical protein